MITYQLKFREIPLVITFPNVDELHTYLDLHFRGGTDNPAGWVLTEISFVYDTMGLLSAVTEQMPVANYLRLDITEN